MKDKISTVLLGFLILAVLSCGMISAPGSPDKKPEAAVTSTLTDAEETTAADDENSREEPTTVVIIPNRSHDDTSAEETTGAAEEETKSPVIITPADKDNTPADKTDTPADKADTPTVADIPSDTPVGMNVWVPTHGGNKYHSKKDCSNMINPVYEPLSQAIAEGFGRCSKCW